MNFSSEMLDIFTEQKKSKVSDIKVRRPSLNLTVRSKEETSYKGSLLPALYTELSQIMGCVLVHSQRPIPMYLIANCSFREGRTKTMQLNPVKVRKILDSRMNLKLLYLKCLSCFYLVSFLACICIIFVTSILVS